MRIPASNPYSVEAQSSLLGCDLWHRLSANHQPGLSHEALSAIGVVTYFSLEFIQRQKKALTMFCTLSGLLAFGYPTTSPYRR
jgi:hypothetical protein